MRLKVFPINHGLFGYNHKDNMKKIILASIATVACCGGAFGQGQVLFGNADNSSAAITLNSPTGPLTGSGLVVELFWYNGSSFVLEDTFTSTYTGSGNALQGPGYFYGGELTIPNTGAQTFYIEASYATGGTNYTGETASFTASVNAAPAPPEWIDYGGVGSWDGNLVLEPVP